jgi:cytochrome c oxidase subunit 2
MSSKISKSGILLLLALFYSCGGGAAKKQNQMETLSTGPDLFNKYVCFTCHSLDGSEMYGPTLQGIYMKEVEVIREGEEVQVAIDRKYLKRSILDPEFEKVKEFQTRTMPKPDISKKEVDILIDYIIGLEKK